MTSLSPQGIPLALIINYFVRAYRLLWVLESESANTKERATNKRMFMFFLRLFVVFAVMWVPTITFMWVLVVSGATGAAIGFLAGSWGHLQGLVSACLYMRRIDIKAEARACATCDVCCCVRLCVASVSRRAARGVCGARQGLRSEIKPDRTITMAVYF